VWGVKSPVGTITQRQVHERGETRPLTVALKTGVGLVIDRDADADVVRR
jgi:hypothetical protein